VRAIHVERLREVQERAATDLTENERRKRRIAAQAALCELDRAEKQGQVARLPVVNAAVIGLITTNKFLGVPSHIAARMPQSVRASVFTLATDEIHAALDELATGGAEILASMEKVWPAEDHATARRA